MEFVNEFTVPTDIEATWRTLLDLEKVAPCLPGATLEEVDGDVYTGRVKVKLGPVTVNYRGTAKLVEVDDAAKRARIDARGKETRGAGTADADISATLKETDAGTLVHVVTDLTVTGKPAQFGRGVMADVGTKIIGQFAQRLEEMVLLGDDAGPARTTATDPAGRGVEIATDAGAPVSVAAGPRTIDADPARADDALDLMEVAGVAAAKRVIPLVAALVALAAVVWWFARR